MTIKEMKELAVYAAKGQAPTNFSVENVDEALRDGLRELAGSLELNLVELELKSSLLK